MSARARYYRGIRGSAALATRALDAVAERRNWCRAAKRALEARLRLSERRLLRVLGALGSKRFLRPLHRDDRGTLWRVYLPAEAQRPERIAAAIEAARRRVGRAAAAAGEGT